MVFGVHSRVEHHLSACYHAFPCRELFIATGAVAIVFRCRGIHGRYQVKLSRLYGSPYDRGFKKCGHCDVFIRYEGVFCPCCGSRLRDRPKGTSSAQRAARIAVRMAAKIKSNRHIMEAVQ